MAHVAGQRSAPEGRRFRSAVVEEEESFSEHGASALPIELLCAYMARRICGRLLRVPVERNARSRGVPLVRRAWRVDAREWRSFAADDSFPRQYRGTWKDVFGVDGGRAEYRADAEVPRVGGGGAGEVRERPVTVTEGPARLHARISRGA